MIYDHISGRLSTLDQQVIEAVPPGGNWRDLPAGFDSQRIKQIRQSAAAGEGSRSTYYGRLRWDRPAYTISTYFNRPGNGCFIHPSSPRLITIREAARLQSFPDTFRFHGNGRNRYIQVGNAVPPLLAAQIARMVTPGSVVDLFAGAGGLSLGFSWVGHQVIAAVDNDPAAIRTLRHNSEETVDVLQANLGDPAENKRITRHVAERVGADGVHLLIGGPPCQGFSTAGHCRLDDPRNNLVFAFLNAAEALCPRFVLMENVPALLWRGRRQTLNEICRRIYSLGYHASVIIAHAEGYGIPQLRRRLFLLGSRAGEPRWPRPWRKILQPAQLSYQPGAQLNENLPSALTVEDAISDLPAATAIEANAAMPYTSPSISPYQRWARGELPLAQVLPLGVQTYIQENIFELASNA